MSQLFANAAITDEIVLSDGTRVRVRRALSATEQARLQERLVVMEMDAVSGQVRKVDVSWSRAKIEVVSAYVVGWDATDEQGQAIVYKPDLAGDLLPEIIEEIATAVDALQNARHEEYKKKARGR